MIEIEKKFLVASGKWPRGQVQIRITQGYLCREHGKVIRVRQKNDDYYLSVKANLDSHSSYDFEYLIPESEALTMLENLCQGRIVRKTRHEVMYESMLWEIDEFHDDNDGLVVAEIELPSITTHFVKPDWLAEEVTDDSRYRNSSLSVLPYDQWVSHKSGE